MNTNGITSSTEYYASSVVDTKNSKPKTDSKKEESVKKSAAASDTAAAYKPSKNEKAEVSTKKTYTRDSETIKKLLDDVKQRQQQLQDLVQRTLAKQGQTLKASETIWDALRSGKLEFSAEEIAQAKEDVSEDGYWGVKQTSERLYSFAYALAGGDPSKADKMMAAIEKGFKQATKAWGDELPDICKQTLEATREKINAWKNQDSTTSETAETTADNQ